MGGEFHMHVTERQTNPLDSDRLERINRTLLRISNDIGSSSSLQELFSAIHHSLSLLIDTTNFYIALYDPERDEVSFPYNVDITEAEKCENLVGATASDSLTVRVMNMRAPLLITKEEILKERGEGKQVYRGAMPEIWLGVPLIDQEQLIGAMVVQSYEGADYFDETDAAVLSGVASQVAMAIARKRLEEELADSAKRFRKIVADVENIAVLGYDRARRVTFWNGASEKLCGYSEQEALGRQLEDLIIPQEMREEMIGAVNSWIQGGSVIPPGELVLKDREGKEVPVYSSHVMNQVGSQQEMFFLGHDLRPIKRVEEALRKANAQFAVAMDALDAEVYVADMQTGELLFLNSQTRQSTGAKVGDICWQVLQKGQTGPCPFCTNNKLVDSTGVPGVPYVWEVQNSKNKRWYQCRDRAIRWPDGRIVRLEIAIDISDRKKAEREREQLEAQLHQAQKMESIGRLAGGVAHDFNNMLGVILGRAEVVLDEAGEGFEFREDLEEILKAASRSADLTRQLLAFARKQSIAPRITDLNSRVADTLTMLHRLLGERIRLIWRPGRDLHPVRIDRGQVDQILTNLCLNARDAMDGEGDITIELTNVYLAENRVLKMEEIVAGHYVCISVSDQGCGMSEEVMENLFEPFFTTKDVGKGTGLGLATLYGIARQNGGFIEVESSVGEGATFKVYLPAEDMNQETEPTPDMVSEQNGIPSKMVLLVEDEPSLLTLTARMLRRLGYQVVAHHTPAEALHYARREKGRIDLLLTDIVMPGISGKELAEMVLALHPEVKILYMTGYTDDESFSTSEGENVLHKPFNSKLLAAHIAKVFQEENNPS